MSQKALDVYYNLALSKHDLNPFATFFWTFACDLGFASYVFSEKFAPGGRLSHEALQRKQLLKIVFHNLLKYSLNNLVYYSLNSSHMCIEIVYTSDQNNVEIEIVYTSTQTRDFRTIKGKQFFVTYFPNVVFLWSRGSIVLLFSKFWPDFKFYVLGFITLFIS